MQGHPNKNGIQNTKHNTKHSETTPMNKQLQRKWHLPNEMLRLTAHIHMTKSRAFRTRKKEYIQAIKNNNSNSGYSNHILNTGHKYRTITDTINIIRTHRKGKHFNTLEKYHIYKISRDKL
jgi:HD-like signal output (HDOD) protein